MYHVKIFGAGSIGNHLAHASRTKGWSVTIADIDRAALNRTRDSIYPTRYGAWDREIVLKDAREAARDPCDIVFIGTPPDSHIRLALDALEHAPPRALLIEKPVCGPDLAGCRELWDAARRSGVFVGVGYNHALTRNTALVDAAVREGSLGPVQTISARTREHWGGIFRAHPWLSGPQDTYLGYSSRGGGAVGEHSHAINIWQHFAHVAGAGRVVEVSATLDFVKDGGAAYDRSGFITLKTESGLVGDVIQDVITAPTEKSARIQCRDGYAEWHVNYRPDADAVKIARGGAAAEATLLPKTRPDDFKVEVDHLEALLAGTVKQSPIALDRGLDTMMVIAAAFRSHELGRRVSIDWTAGYTPDAIR